MIDNVIAALVWASVWIALAGAFAMLATGAMTILSAVIFPSRQERPK